MVIAPRTHTLTLIAVFAIACNKEAERLPGGSAAAAESSMRPGELGIVDGDFPPEPGDAVAQALKDGQGWISVRTKDEWARVSIDDQRVGDTPINRAPVTAGRHTVALQFSQGSNVSGVFVIPVAKHVRLTGVPLRDNDSARQGGEARP